MSAYFVIKQLSTKTHSRYDSFFASLLDDDIIVFPENVRILSWNYDFQFEKAYSNYLNIKEIGTNKAQLNVITKRSRSTNFVKDNFCIIKLNGTTELYQRGGISNKFEYFKEIQDELTEENFDMIIENFRNSRAKTHEIETSLFFSWEKDLKDSDKKTFIERVVDIASGTGILVVVGYSFPYFNRKVDRQIIRNMKNLRKVYIQSPEAESIKDRFKAIRDDIELISISEIGQFYLPNEL